MKIKCTACGIYNGYPVEWIGLNYMDRAYLEDDFLCESCSMEKEQADYYRSGMAELNEY